MKERTINTLFMLSSLDGKINSGASDELDVDKDWKNINGIKEGIQQYYDIEKTTDLFSFITGRTLEKIGTNDIKKSPSKTDVSFIVVDNKQYLNENGIKYFSNLAKKLIIVTTNENYNTYNYDNVDIIYYEEKIEFEDLFRKIKTNYNASNVTIQSGGTLNGVLLRAKLIDYVNIVIAPVLVGGKETPTLVDGESIMKEADLNKLGVLELVECKVLKDSYINLKYKVIS